MPLPGQIASNTLELIGNTPIVLLRSLSADGEARIFGKLEALNPGGSVKDRICLAMVEAAERDGRLRPGGTILEPTSGNTGIGLAMVAAARGYRLILTMPDTMSEERRSLLRAYGAELVLTSDSKGMLAAIARAEEILAEHPDYFMPGQFNNPANPEAHRRSTARELLYQCPRVDAFVAGVGTGGTISGVGAVLKRERPGVQIVAVEPAASAVLSGRDPGRHAIQGIGPGFVPANLDRTVIDRVIAVSDHDAAETTRKLAAQDGVLVGISSGAAAFAAAQVARSLPGDAIVVCVLSDSGERYLTSHLFEDGGL
ncbi:MAG: cysteine synthase A [Deltaproteobacteria bacterium]|nr:cysteine synthase A [Deltaproteobacteria bacterium]